MVANRSGDHRAGRERKEETLLPGPSRRTSSRIKKRELRGRSDLPAISEDEGTDEGQGEGDEDPPADTPVGDEESQQTTGDTGTRKDLVKQEGGGTDSISLSPGVSKKINERWSAMAQDQEVFLASTKPPEASSTSSSGMPPQQAATSHSNPIATAPGPSRPDKDSNAMMVLLREVREQQEQMLKMFSSQAEELKQVKRKMSENDNNMAIMGSSQDTLGEMLANLMNQEQQPSEMKVKKEEPSPKKPSREKYKPRVKEEPEESDDSSSSSDSESSEDDPSTPSKIHHP